MDKRNNGEPAYSAAHHLHHLGREAELGGVP
jgi:hypothetical protein